MIDKSIDEIIEAIKGSGGIISTIAKRLGVAWSTADKYIQQSEEAKQALADEREAILDMAVGALYSSIKEGNTQDAKWFLATKGRKRGFNEKIDIEHSGGLNIIYLDKQDENI